MRTAAKSIARRKAIIDRRVQYAPRSEEYRDENEVLRTHFVHKPRVPLPTTRSTTWRDIKREWINRSKYMPHVEDAKHLELANG